MRRTIVAGMFTGIAFTSSAQTDTAKNGTTSFTYSADVYYRYDFNDAQGNNNNITSFTNSRNSFELGMASVRADHVSGKVSATADLGFGKRAQEFSYNDVNTLVAVKQLYISYAPFTAVKFTIGKWATHIGYEMPDAYANRNYSMSYAFSYGPFFHTGLKADIALGRKTSFMLGVANPTDFSTTTSAAKVFIMQMSSRMAGDKLKLYINFQGGTDFNQFDVVVCGTVSRKFTINYDGTRKTMKTGNQIKNWSGNALYFNYDPDSVFGLTLREEYFTDRENMAGIGTSVIQTTLSGNIHLNNLTIIPEIRFDQAGNAIFSKGSGIAVKNDASFILAAVYRF